MKKLLKSTLLAVALAGSVHTSGHPASADPEKTITVFKTPWCGCCQVWVEAMEKAGYTVNSTNMEDLSMVKQQAGITKEMEACHTSIIGHERKYILEGHVPVEAVEKLMTERPDIQGLSTPGMPAGSLGMNYDPDARYTVFSYTGETDESPKVFYEAGK